MKNSKLVYTLTVFSVVIQNYGVNKYKQFPELMFMIGIPKLDESFNILSLMSMLFPVILMTFLFNERIHNLISRSGKLYVVRSYSKTKLIIKSVFTSILEIIVLTLAEFLIYSVFPGKLYNVKAKSIILSFIMFVFVNIGVVLVEYMLQYFFNTGYTTLIICLFIFVGCSIGLQTKSKFLRIILFPTLMFGLYNGAVSNVGIYVFNLLAVMIINIILLFCNIYKFKNSDVF